MPLSTKMILDIFETLSVQYNFDKDEAVTMLSKQFELPKNMVPNETPKKITSKTEKNTLFASKQAQELAELHSITPTGEGNGKNGTFTLTDIKNMMKKNNNSNQTVNISPAASKFANDNNINVSSITGTGTNGSIILKDLKDFLTKQEESNEQSNEESNEESKEESKAESEVELESESGNNSGNESGNESDNSQQSEKSQNVPDISPKALAFAKENHLDLSTINIEPSGGGGKILVQDLKKYLSQQGN